MSFISRSSSFFVILYCAYIYGASGGEPYSHYQNVEQFEDQRRGRPTTRSGPIACRVCRRVFLDNVSLVLHSECHLEDEIPTLGQNSGSPSSFQNDRNVSVNPSQFSSPSVESTSETRQISVPGTTDHSRPNGWLRDASLLQIQWLRSSIDARRKLLQSSVRSTMSSIFHSQLGESRAPCDWASPPLQINEQDGRQKLSKSRNPPINQIAASCKEVIVISDDEEDDNNGPAEMLDLTLKL